MGSYDFEHCWHKQHYACFDCRKSFKAGDEYVFDETGAYCRRTVVCPECGQPMKAMGLLFRAPPKRAIKTWKRLQERFDGISPPPFQFPRPRSS